MNQRNMRHPSHRYGPILKARESLGSRPFSTLNPVFTLCQSHLPIKETTLQMFKGSLLCPCIKGCFAFTQKQWPSRYLRHSSPSCLGGAASLDIGAGCTFCVWVVKPASRWRKEEIVWSVTDFLVKYRGRHGDRGLCTQLPSHFLTR